MKWIGENIHDYVSRFRGHTYFENSITLSTGKSITLDEYTSGTISITKIQDSGTTFNDNDTSLMTAAAIADKIEAYGYSTTAGDITGVTAGVGLSGGGASGAVTLTLDLSELSDVTPVNGDKLATLDSDGSTEQLTAVADLATLFAGSGLTEEDGTLNVNDNLTNLTTIGSAGATTDIAAGDLTMYNPVNNGNPTISIGSSATNRFEIKTAYNSGAQTIDEVYFSTYTTSSTANDGRYIWEVDEVELARMIDNGLVVKGNVLANDANAYLQAWDTTASSATQGGGLRLISDDGAAMADDHRLGVIEFKGAEDGSGTLSTGARIQAICRDAWDGSNNDADLEFYTTDGTTESKVLTLDADKLATFTGAVTVTGALTCTTDLATDQQKHLAWFEIAGFATGDGTNYEISVNLDNDTAPFSHNVSTGSAGTTAITVQNIMRSGGTVMPRAGTVKRWTGWATTAGSSTANVALFKITPTRNNNSNVAPVLIDNVAYTALGNAKMEDFDETSFTDADLAAGDIVVTGIKCENNKTTYFTSTLEIEWD
jgi:hypothetical protein|tara:strand:+ start:1061 stop:2686 length:1626 start_codon:yes stop_codon:yes gene_type:complete